MKTNMTTIRPGIFRDHALEGILDRQMDHTGSRVEWNFRRFHSEDIVSVVVRYPGDVRDPEEEGWVIHDDEDYDPQDKGSVDDVFLSGRTDELMERLGHQESIGVFLKAALSTLMVDKDFIGSLPLAPSSLPTKVTCPPMPLPA